MLHKAVGFMQDPWRRVYIACTHEGGQQNKTRCILCCARTCLKCPSYRAIPDCSHVFSLYIISKIGQKLTRTNIASRAYRCILKRFDPFVTVSGPSELKLYPMGSSLLHVSFIQGTCSRIVLSADIYHVLHAPSCSCQLTL